MNRTVVRSLAILSLWSCLFTLPRFATPARAQAVGTTGTPLDIDINDLFRHWVHSSEEERPGGTVRVFRPAASRTFPPSRFRMAYRFARDGGCEFYFLSPDDAHHFRPCTWTISTGSTVILRISANESTTSFRIAQLSEEILRLTPLAPQRDK